MVGECGISKTLQATLDSTMVVLQPLGYPAGDHIDGLEICEQLCYYEINNTILQNE